MPITFPDLRLFPRTNEQCNKLADGGTRCIADRSATPQWLKRPTKRGRNNGRYATSHAVTGGVLRGYDAKGAPCPAASERSQESGMRELSLGDRLSIPLHASPRESLPPFKRKWASLFLSGTVLDAVGLARISFSSSSEHGSANSQSRCNLEIDALNRADDAITLTPAPRSLSHEAT